MSKPRLIAFYLPQFYPTPENDEWWEPGFTEWTNVARAKPLFPGHYQPKIPRDLSFYDLRVPETREKQAQLAREAGIEGFCYWHYWFGNGKRLLDQVFREVIETGKPDFPFCLCWANHSWYRKVWDPTKGQDKLLVEQTYPGEQDYIDHFKAMLPAFKDSRYMKVNGKLIFGVFLHYDIPDFSLLKSTWNRLAKENGLKGFYFIALSDHYNNETPIKNGFDATMDDSLLSYRAKDYSNKLKNYLWKFIIKLTKRPRLCNYDGLIDLFEKDFISTSVHHPILVPNFDHSPRSENRGVVIHNSTPDKWKKLLSIAIKKCSNKEENLIFIKAWNEWGEGNYLEPDRKYGKKYIEATKAALDNIIE